MKNAESFNTLIAKDKEVVKGVLLITGVVEGIKSGVNDYLNTFKKYTFLWTDDKSVKYSDFMKDNPDLEAFECELKKYMDVEDEVQCLHTCLHTSLYTFLFIFC